MESTFIKYTYNMTVTCDEKGIMKVDILNCDTGKVETFISAEANSLFVSLTGLRYYPKTSRSSEEFVIIISLDKTTLELDNLSITWSPNKHVSFIEKEEIYEDFAKWKTILVTYLHMNLDKSFIKSCEKLLDFKKCWCDTAENRCDSCTFNTNDICLINKFICKRADGYILYEEISSSQLPQAIQDQIHF